MKGRLTLLLIALATAGGWLVWRQATAPRSIPVAGAIDPSAEPEQTALAGAAPIRVSFPGGEAELVPQAAYRVQAEVCGRKRYRGSWTGALAPDDLCLFWGPLVRPEIARHLTFTQDMRWYHFRFDADAPLDVGTVTRHSANTHVLSATTNLRRAVGRLSAGDVVALEGFLVNLSGAYEGQPITWTTSLSREDDGAGACEVLYLTALRKDGRLYR